MPHHAWLSKPGICLVCHFHWWRNENFSLVVFFLIWVRSGCTKTVVQPSPHRAIQCCLLYSWFRLISCWKLFRWGSHVVGARCFWDSPLTHLTRECQTSHETMRSLFVVAGHIWDDLATHKAWFASSLLSKGYSVMLCQGRSKCKNYTTTLLDCVLLIISGK